MGALNPVVLLAALSVGVPLFLHLFQRHQARRLAFPALRYLERTEREHARRIRFRQLLLLFLRMTVLLLLVGAGARLFLRGPGADHPPTALAIILDNSMSTGLVLGERRVLDELKERALASLDLAGPEDRIWLIRAGEPWRPLAPLTPGQARAEVLGTEVSDARGDVSAALARAAGVLGGAPFDAREIHLISDLQASGFDAQMPAPAGRIPVTVWAGSGEPPANRALADVVVGGGLPPLQGEATEITVHAAEGGDGPVPVRIVMDGRIRGASTLTPGTSVSLPLPPVQEGWITGWAETDPDALRADDRRAFAFRARPAPVVDVRGDGGAFLAQAVAVLTEARRLRTPEGPANLLVAAGGDGLEAAVSGAAVLVIPPADPTLLPGLNRRLAASGIPWRFERQAEKGFALVEGREAPTVLEGVEARRWYRLTSTVSPLESSRILARAGGDPWLVEGSDGRGRRYLLLASPVVAEASTLPVSTAMVRFVDWAATEWAADGESETSLTAGDEAGAPRQADRVRLPDGTERPVDGSRTVRNTGATGFYTFLDGDSVVSVVAVNPHPAESEAATLGRQALPGAVGLDIVPVDDPRLWGRSIFRTRQGPELWWPFVAAALALLLLEAGVAAAGRVTSSGRRPAPSTSEVHAAQ